MLNQTPRYKCLPLVILTVILFLTLFLFLFSVGIEEAADRLMDSVDGLQCLTMTAENPPSGDLIPAPLVTCKLCLCEQSLDKMTILQECQCIFCTPVSSPQCLLSWEVIKGKIMKVRGYLSVAYRVHHSLTLLWKANAHSAWHQGLMRARRVLDPDPWAFKTGVPMHTCGSSLLLSCHVAQAGLELRSSSSVSRVLDDPPHPER